MILTSGQIGRLQNTNNVEGENKVPIIKDGELKKTDINSINEYLTPVFNITGIVITGYTLSIVDNDLNGSYQWNSDGIPIPKATSSTFVVTPAVEGTDITLRQDSFYSQNSLSNFSPNELGVDKVVFWLDASDNNTITSISNSISQWSDKSGNNNNFTQVNTARQPLINDNSLNSLNGVNFDGSKVISSTINSPSSDFTLMTAQNVLSFDNNLKKVIDTFGAGNNRVYSQRTDASNGGLGVYDGSNWQAVTNTADSVTGLQIQTFAETSVNGGVYINGTQITSHNFTNREWNAITLLGKPDIQSFNGNVGDIMLITQDATIETRQKLEGYLAWKYALTSDLPINHPYKVIAP